MEAVSDQKSNMTPEEHIENDLLELRVLNLLVEICFGVNLKMLLCTGGPGCGSVNSDSHFLTLGDIFSYLENTRERRKGLINLDVRPSWTKRRCFKSLKLCDYGAAVVPIATI